MVNCVAFVNKMNKDRIINVITVLYLINPSSGIINVWIQRIFAERFTEDCLGTKEGIFYNIWKNLQKRVVLTNYRQI